jgi:serine phosphatase RsbU (regulator of sigma subunit)
MGWNSTSVETAVGEVRYTDHIQLSSALGRLQKESRAIRVAVFLGLFVLTVWLDLSVDHDLSLFALYLIPTLYSAWYLGSRWAYGSCLAGGAVWVIDDWPWWHSYHHALIPFGNLAGKLAVLTVIVAILNALKNALEVQYEAGHRLVVRELEIASEVQRRLLPSQLPDYPGLDLGFVYRPAHQLGGDYYDFIPLGPERIAITVADVSGKGLPSALLMATLQSLVRTNLAAREGKLTRFAREVSERLYEQTTNERYITLFFAILDLSSLTLQYVNTGHNPPLFFRKWTLLTRRSSAEVLDKGGPPLGMFPATEYVCGRTLLQEGDVLVLYTDGIVDALNTKQEQFGEERLRDVIRSSQFLSAAEICKRFVSRLDAFTAGNPQWDDITLVVVKVKADSADSPTKAPVSAELYDHETYAKG